MERPMFKLTISSVNGCPDGDSLSADYLNMFKRTWA